MPLLLDLVQTICLSYLNVRVFKNRRRTYTHRHTHTHIYIYIHTHTHAQLPVRLHPPAHIHSGFTALRIDHCYIFCAIAAIFAIISICLLLVLLLPFLQKGPLSDELPAVRLSQLGGLEKVVVLELATVKLFDHDDHVN